MQLPKIQRKQVGRLDDNEKITREFDELIKQVNQSNELIKQAFAELDKFMKWRSGAGLPSKNLGVDGEFYLEEITKTIYKKVNGNWV